MPSKTRKMPSVMEHAFSQVPSVSLPRSSFDRSHGVKTTGSVGYLIPFFVEEGFPGDTMNVSFKGFARLTTLLRPLMDNQYIDTHFFEVPIRVLFDDWKKLQGETVNPGDSTDYLMPIINSDPNGYDNETIFDYMGLPTNVEASFEHRADFLRAYNKIFADWYQDQNLQNAPTVNTGPGPDLHTDYTVLKRNKRHDYFTSCLPWPQKGEEVRLPIGDTAQVQSNGQPFQLANPGGVDPETFGLQAGNTNWLSNAAPTQHNNTEYYDGLEVNLATATAATINEWRYAFQVQRVLERDARGGTRYNEIILSHWGVNMPSERWRSVYLGGGSTPINITAIPQTVDDETGQERGPLGKLGGIGTADMTQHGFVKSFDEHSIVLGILSIRTDLTYQQGRHRMWDRRSRFDFYMPAFAHLGEQPVKSSEIYLDGSAADDEIFGYQEAWADMRYKPSMITGKFRSNDPQSLDFWHLSQYFENRPVLGEEFIQEDPPMDRVLAVTDEPHFILDAYLSFRHARVMPTFSVPGLIDHF